MDIEFLVAGNCVLRKKDQDPMLRIDYKTTFEPARRQQLPGRRRRLGAATWFLCVSAVAAVPAICNSEQGAGARRIRQCCPVAWIISLITVIVQAAIFFVAAAIRVQVFGW